MQIFISYAHSDRPYVQDLVRDLEETGVEVWIDFNNIKPGEDWDKSVEAALKVCDAMILVLTPRSVESQNVRPEWSYFLELNKPIYPILVEPCDIPFRLRLHHYVDFQGDRDYAFKQLLRTIGVDEAPAPQADMAPGATATREFDAVEVPVYDPAAEIKPLPFEPETIVIPRGIFPFGSTPPQITGLPDRHARKWAEEHEVPQRMLPLPDFRIGRYPVTVGQYRQFLEAGGYYERRFWTGAGWSWRQNGNVSQPSCWAEDEGEWVSDDNLPVVCVSWYEAFAYCRWLAEETGRPYRLPTEAEWEKAARGKEGRIFPWGDIWLDNACHANKPDGRTMRVGRCSPDGDSPYGVSDMSGNVWEWCRTKWRDKYEHRADDNIEGTDRRVLRGGSWAHDLNYLRCAYRSWESPRNRTYSIGFRVVCAVVEQPNEEPEAE